VSFPAIMVLLVVVTGLIWLTDKYLWAPQRDKETAEPVIVEYARSFFSHYLSGISDSFVRC
jgi:signal peptidase I